MVIVLLYVDEIIQYKRKFRMSHQGAEIDVASKV